MLKLLASLLISTELVIAAPLGISLQSGCSLEAVLANQCSTSDGSSLTVTGERTTPGTAGPQSPDRTSPQSPTPVAPAPVDPVAKERARCLEAGSGPRGCLLTRPSEPDADPVAETPPSPVITITDLAGFAPASARPVGEPSNLGVVGLPTNFVAPASVHVREGTLFGLPLRARFTPAGFDFDFGDGSSLSSTSAGTTWEQLGQAQFTPTATSHVYRERGIFEARVSVRYTAEIDPGSGWIPLEGQLSVAGPAQQIRIVESHTALVESSCTERPRAPGC
ncbi:hypothetical protein RS83_00539 [Microbacterium oxydans]|uniref:PKD domain-containing protein n=1 Tax=Microbacterium oxydans TaxID=82380 RepID=A0A0F0LD71_9MICO|nr:hypothetical protein RS83_00539 [Microbacterium oxydans]